MTNPHDPTEGQRTLTELRDEIISRLDKKYDLIYVQRDDRLTPQQVEVLAEKGPIDEFWDSMENWESDSKWESTQYIIAEITGQLVREDGTWADVVGDFFYTDEYDEVRFAIEERDNGNWPRELASQTPAVLMRANVDYRMVDPEASEYPEDNAWPQGEESPDPADALKRVGLPVTEHNIKVMNSIFAEYNPYWDGAVGQWVFAADVEWLYDLTDNADAIIEITNPFLWVNNPWQGNGWVNEQAFEGTVRIRRGNLHTDKGAWGYAWDDVVGGVYISAYEVELNVVEPAVVE